MIAAGLGAGLLGGGVAGVIIGSPGFASAENLTTTTAPANDTKPNEKSTEFARRREERIRSVLKPLVDKGTLSQEQADEVVKALLAAEPTGSRHGGRGFGHKRRGMEEVAKALGLTTDELRTELKQDKTLAEIAKAKGVPVQKVIDAMVAQARKQLDRAVEAGRLTKDQADERAQDLTKRITDAVNNGFKRANGPGRGWRADGRFGRGHD